MSGRCALLACSALLLSCGQDAPRTRERDTSAKLEAGIVARIGNDAIPASLVAAVAAAQGLSPEEALRKLIDDAVAAESARRRRLDVVPPARWRLTSARGRFTADKLRDAAIAAGQPTTAEVEELTLRHWQEVDRAVAVRVVHALIERPKDPKENAAAEQKARGLRASLAEATSAEDFTARGKALAARVEDLPPFIEEAGWVTQGGGQMDQTFATAAHSLKNPGDTTGVVETSFGWHVIRLVERIPEQKLSYEARRAAFLDEAQANRSVRALEALLQQLRAKHPVVISSASEQLMRSVLAEADPQEPKR